MISKSSVALTVTDAVSKLQHADQRVEWLWSLDASTEDEAFAVLDYLITQGYELREKSTCMLCVALATLKERWDRGQVPLSVQGEFDHRFYNYANEKTGHSYSRSALDNLMDVGRTWLCPETVALPERVELYDAKGEPTGDIVVMNPWRVDTSRLVHAKCALKDGGLADNLVALGQLFNPNVSIRTFMQTLRGPTDNSQTVPQKERMFYFEGPYLMMMFNGKHDDAQIMAEVNWEGIEQSQELYRTWQWLAGVLGVDWEG